MGLQFNLVLANGLTAPGAYGRVDSVMGSKESLDFSFNVYSSRKAFIDKLPQVEQRMYTFTPSVEDDAVNFIKQAYRYIKRLPDYVDAIDVLEYGQTP